MIKWISEIIAALALAVAIISALHSNVQTEIAREQATIARQSYDAAVEQLALAKQAQGIAEADHKVAVEQLELQRDMIDADRQFPVVLGGDVDDSLSGPLSSGKNVTFSLFNGSKHAVPYKVIVRSDGVGVYRYNETPSKMEFAVSLDRRPILIQANSTYRVAFSTWISKVPSSTGKIAIYVNDQKVIEYDYLWNSETKSYVCHQCS